jgi:membrane associated rhomboid family serine protease
MSPSTASSISFPPFRGTTRRLVLINLIAYFALLFTGLLSGSAQGWLILHFGFWPSSFVHGAIWQSLTYSLVHIGVLSTASELVSLWFLTGFLEQFHPRNWVAYLYAASILGSAISSALIYAFVQAFTLPLHEIPLLGCFGAIFGMLAAIGVLYADVEFSMLLLPITIKAKYLAIISALIAFAMLFSSEGMYAFAKLGGGVAGLLYIWIAPRRGVSHAFSEKWYGLRNRYYRWKRRRAARKFEVYMRSQGKTVRFDGSGKQIDDDPNDKKRWN